MLLLEKVIKLGVAVLGEVETSVGREVCSHGSDIRYINLLIRSSTMRWDKHEEP